MIKVITVSNKLISILIPYKQVSNEVYVWNQTRVEAGDSSLVGKLEFPGGKVEATESPLDAVVREVFEETNVRLNPKSVELFKIYYFSKLEIHAFIVCDLEDLFLSEQYINLSSNIENLDILPNNKIIFSDLSTYFQRFKSF